MGCLMVFLLIVQVLSFVAIVVAGLKNRNKTRALLSRLSWPQHVMGGDYRPLGETANNTSLTGSGGDSDGDSLAVWMFGITRIAEENHIAGTIALEYSPSSDSDEMLPNFEEALAEHSEEDDERPRHTPKVGIDSLNSDDNNSDYSDSLQEFSNAFVPHPPDGEAPGIDGSLPSGAASSAGGNESEDFPAPFPVSLQRGLGRSSAFFMLAVYAVFPHVAAMVLALFSLTFISLFFFMVGFVLQFCALFEATESILPFQTPRAIYFLLVLSLLLADLALLEIDQSLDATCSTSRFPVSRVNEVWVHVCGLWLYSFFIAPFAAAWRVALSGSRVSDPSQKLLFRVSVVVLWVTLFCWHLALISSIVTFDAQFDVADVIVFALVTSVGILDCACGMQTTRVSTLDQFEMTQQVAAEQEIQRAQDGAENERNRLALAFCWRESPKSLGKLPVDIVSIISDLAFSQRLIPFDGARLPVRSRIWHFPTSRNVFDADYLENDSVGTTDEHHTFSLPNMGSLGISMTQKRAELVRLVESTTETGCESIGKSDESQSLGTTVWLSYGDNERFYLRPDGNTVMGRDTALFGGDPQISREHFKFSCSVLGSEKTVVVEAIGPNAKRGTDIIRRNIDDSKKAKTKIKGSGERVLFDRSSDRSSAWNIHDGDALDLFKGRYRLVLRVEVDASSAIKKECHSAQAAAEVICDGFVAKIDANSRAGLIQKKEHVILEDDLWDPRDLISQDNPLTGSFPGDISWSSFFRGRAPYLVPHRDARTVTIGTPFVAVDHGSCTLKAGLCADSPILGAVPSLLATFFPNDYSHREVVAGRRNIARACTVPRLDPVIQRGMVTDWDGLERLYHEMFYNELRVSPRDYGVSILLPLMTPMEWFGENMLQLLYESFEVPRVAMHSFAPLTLLSTGRSSGFVLSCGDGLTQACAVLNGRVLPGTERRMHLAGADVTQAVQILHGNKISLEVARDMKERSGSVRPGLPEPAASDQFISQIAHSSSYSLEIAGDTRGREAINSSKRESRTLREVSIERATECLFDPCCDLSVPKLVMNSLAGLNSSDLPLKYSFGRMVPTPRYQVLGVRRDVAATLVITGGTAKMPGFVERMNAELKLRSLAVFNRVVDDHQISRVNANGVWTAAELAPVFSNEWSAVYGMLEKGDAESTWLERSWYMEHGPERAARELRGSI